MPPRLPTPASRSLETAQPLVHLPQQIRSGSLLRRGVTKLKEDPYSVSHYLRPSTGAVRLRQPIHRGSLVRREYFDPATPFSDSHSTLKFSSVKVIARNSYLQLLDSKFDFFVDVGNKVSDVCGEVYSNLSAVLKENQSSVSAVLSKSSSWSRSVRNSSRVLVNSLSVALSSWRRSMENMSVELINSLLVTIDRGSWSRSSESLSVVLVNPPCTVILASRMASENEEGSILEEEFSENDHQALLIPFTLSSRSVLSLYVQILKWTINLWHFQNLRKRFANDECINAGGPTDSDSSSFSKDDSDGHKASVLTEQDQACLGASIDRKGVNDLTDGGRVTSLFDQVEQSSQQKPNPSEFDEQQNGEISQNDRPASPERIYRPALLKNRFADTILKILPIYKEVIFELIEMHILSVADPGEVLVLMGPSGDAAKDALNATKAVDEEDIVGGNCIISTCNGVLSMQEQRARGAFEAFKLVVNDPDYAVGLSHMMLEKNNLPGANFHHWSSYSHGYTNPSSAIHWDLKGEQKNDDLLADVFFFIAVMTKSMNLVSSLGCHLTNQGLERGRSPISLPVSPIPDNVLQEKVVNK